MLAGYKPGYEAGNSLDFGAVEIWDSSEKHGLSFGLGNAILDQHFYQHGRMGRLLNTIAMPDVPHIGIGIDAYTGVHVIDNKTIENVFGLFTITILDGESYHSADSVQYRGPRNLLSLRNILVHILSPGEFSYDLSTKHHSLANPPEKLNRQFNSLKLPENAGSLILSGNLGTFLPGDPILNRFVNLSGGHNAKLLAIAAGYPSTQEANNAIDQLSAALPVPFQSLIIKQDTFKPIELPEGMTGIILIGKDQSLVPVHLLTPVIKAWRSGTTLLSDDAASAVIGSYYSAHPPSPQDEMMAEAATQKSFLIGNTVIRQGLGLLDVTLESRILENNRWGRFFSLAYNHPELLAIGLPDHTALEITQNNPAIVGDNVAFILDLRSAKLDLGTNQGFVIANGLLDVFAPGEILQPELADINRAPVRIGTPVLPTLTSTITATPIETPIPAEISQVEIQPLEQTPPSIPEKNTRPTPTPLVIPPPADPGKAKLIILGGAMAALIVLIGVLINRRLVN
jgi:cyanophycinase-like exopeptidase